VTIALPEELQPSVRAIEAREDISMLQAVWDEYRNVILAAVVAGVSGRYTGRRRASFENTVIGGIYAGFSAYRDPRADLATQLVVALGQGATWGLTDVYFPKLLDWVSGRAPGSEA
jgi:hypothetical protein